MPQHLTQDQKLKCLFGLPSKQRYDGVLIHQEKDEEGVIEVIESQGVRSLHFGSLARQSAMDLNEPDQLHLEYARVMSAWMLFKRVLDDQALLIGLGGGSLAKHILHRFPRCQMKVIEYRSRVVKIAHRYFDLPQEARLDITIGDGAWYVKEHLDDERERYSLLLIDAFDHEGMASSICNWQFFDHCQQLLKKDGLLVINLWGGVRRPQFQQVALWLGKLFDWKLLFLPVQGRGNIIGFAFNDSTPFFSLRELRARAILLERQHKIEYSKFLKEILKHNTSVLKNILRS